MSDMYAVREHLDNALRALEAGDYDITRAHVADAIRLSFRNRKPRKPNIGAPLLTPEEKRVARKLYYIDNIPMQKIAQMMDKNIGRIHEAIVGK